MICIIKAVAWEAVDSTYAVIQGKSSISAPDLVRKMEQRLGGTVRDAYELAAAIHEGQTRKTGEPYIQHPLAVAETLFDIGADADVVCAALLHDTLEEGADSAKIEEEIHNRFGDHVLYLVRAVSKDDRILDRQEKHSAYLEQIIQAFSLDVFVFFLKVADLLQNIGTLTALDPDKQKKWIRELKYDYLPIFSEFYHRIPSHYREMYHRLLDALQTVIYSYDTHEFPSSSSAANPQAPRIL